MFQESKVLTDTQAQQDAPVAAAPSQSPAAGTAGDAYLHGLRMTHRTLVRICAVLPDIVDGLEHSKFRQRLGRYLMSSLRHTDELESLLPDHATLSAPSMADPTLDELARQAAASRQPGRVIGMAGLVRVLLCMQRSMCEHLAATARSAGFPNHAAILHGIVEECAALDTKFLALVREGTAAEAPVQFAAPVVPARLAQIRSSAGVRSARPAAVRGPGITAARVRWSVDDGR